MADHHTLTSLLNEDRGSSADKTKIGWHRKRAEGALKESRRLKQGSDIPPKNPDLKGAKWNADFAHREAKEANKLKKRAEKHNPAVGLEMGDKGGHADIDGLMRKL